MLVAVRERDHATVHKFFTPGFIDPKTQNFRSNGPRMARFSVRPRDRSRHGHLAIFWCQSQLRA